MNESANRSRTRGSHLRRLTLHGYRFAVLAAIVLLVRWHHARSTAAQHGPVQIPLAEVQRILPAETLEPAADRDGAYVHDETGKRIGWVVTTLPACADIIGFSGPTNVLLATDADNQIAGLRILDSRDTPEHLQAVLADGKFLQQFVGRTPESLSGGPTIDAVSGATLTSLAIVESIIQVLGGDPPNYRFPTEITLDDVKAILPAADQLQPLDSPRGWLRILDASGNPIGTAWRTSPAADHHVGYQGPTDVLVVLDAEGKVKQLAVRSSFDNEPYVRYVREDYSFPEYLAGYDPQLAQLDRQAAGIEGVSGATMTSQAAIQSVAIAAAAAQQTRQEEQARQAQTRIVLSWRDGVTAGVLLAALVIAFSDLRGQCWVQIAFGIVVIGYLGFFAGDIPLALFAGWSRNPIPWAKCLGLVLVAAAAFAVPLFSKRQLYCNHVCPHGAAQMLVFRLSKWCWNVPRRLRLVLSAIVPILLVVGVLTAMGQIDVNLAAIEPFDAYVPSIAGWASIAIAVGGLFFSAFVPMGYCRYGCPTGAILSHLRDSAGSDRWTHRDTFATALLGLAAVCFAI